MAALTIIMGRAGSGKTAMVMGQIARAVEKKEPGQLMLIPEQYSHEAEKELCRVCGDSLSLYGEVLSFSRLAACVEEELGIRCALLDKGGRMLAMKMALSALDDRLKIYTGACRRPEMISELLALVSELKSDAISAEMLGTAAKAEEGILGDKLYDFSLILGAYNGLISRDEADPGDRLTMLRDNLAKSKLGDRGHIYIDGFSDFTVQEMGVIGALLDKAAEMTVCLTCDGLNGESEIFETSRKTALRLLSMARERGKEVTVINPELTAKNGAPALAFLEEYLFSYAPTHCEDKEDAVRLYSAPDETAECALAAAKCLEIVRTTGCRWRDIAIAVRGFSDYAQNLESIFKYYGVPLYIGRRSSVGEMPLTRMLRGTFDVLSGGWEASTVIAWLKTGLCGAEPTELDDLENYALQWELRGSIWTRETTWTMPVEGFSALEDEKNKSELKRLDTLRRRLTGPLYRYSQKSDEASTAREQTKAFAEYLEELNLAETLSKRTERLTARGFGTSALEYSQLWEILVSALEQFDAVLGDMSMDREEFGKLLVAMIGQYDVGTIPASMDAVSGGEMDRMRRRNLKHLIVLGASDDRLPAAEREDVLLTADERERLAQRGLGLASPRTDGLYRELEMIYNCLTLPEDSLTMSYSVGGGEGERRPSLIFTRLSFLTGKSAISYDREMTMLCASTPALELAGEHSGLLSQCAWDYFEKEDGFERRMERLKAAASMTRGHLSRESVRALYGETPRVSASRAERFAECGYAYFLQYGLRAKERKKAEFDPPEFGKFMHFILENVTREAQKAGGFAHLNDSRRDALVNQYIDLYIKDVLYDFQDKSERFIYLFRRLSATVRHVVADMASELASSDFQPLDFELDLSGSETLSDGVCSVDITGIADRVDGWIQGDKLYLRVVDYKTGKKAFSLSDVWYGMGLQMLMYLFTLEKTGKERYGKDIIPAGVLYIPARDVLVKSKKKLSAEEIISERTKMLKRSGLLLRDQAVLEAMEHGQQPRYIPVKFSKEGEAVGDSLASLEQLGLLAGHIEKTLLSLASELRNGNIDASPFFRSSMDNACVYCDYREICRFDEMKDHRRWQTKLKAPDVWNLLMTRAEEEKA